MLKIKNQKRFAELKEDYKEFKRVCFTRTNFFIDNFSLFFALLATFIYSYATSFLFFFALMGFNGTLELMPLINIMIIGLCVPQYMYFANSLNIFYYKRLREKSKHIYESEEMKMLKLLRINCPFLERKIQD